MTITAIRTEFEHYVSCFIEIHYIFFRLKIIRSYDGAYTNTYQTPNSK